MKQNSTTPTPSVIQGASTTVELNTPYENAAPIELQLLLGTLKLGGIDLQSPKTAMTIMQEQGITMGGSKGDGSGAQTPSGAPPAGGQQPPQGTPPAGGPGNQSGSGDLGAPPAGGGMVRPGLIDAVIQLLEIL